VLGTSFFLFFYPEKQEVSFILGII